MKTPASPRHSGLMLQRASSEIPRNTCSTSIRPNTVSARPSKSASRPGSPSPLSPSAIAHRATMPRTTNAAATGSEPRRARRACLLCRGVPGPPAPDQQQQEGKPGADAQHVDHRPERNQDRRIRQRERKVDERPHRGQSHGGQQRHAAQPAAQPKPQIETEGGVAEARHPVAPGGDRREVGIHGAGRAGSSGKGGIVPRNGHLLRPTVPGHAASPPSQCAPAPVSTTPTVSNRMTMSRNSVWFFT